MCGDLNSLEPQWYLARRLLHAQPHQVRGYGMTLRRQILENAADIFHHNALLDIGHVCSVAAQSDATRELIVKHLFTTFSKEGGVLATRDWAPPVYPSSPCEVSQKITATDLQKQYRRLRSLVHKMVSQANAGILPSWACGPLNEVRAEKQQVACPHFVPIL